MPEVLCTLPLPEPFPTAVSVRAHIRVLGYAPSAAQLAAELKAHPADILCPQLADPITAEVIVAGAPSLRGICQYAVGFNNIDLSAATQQRVAVTNTPGVLTDATADMTLALLLAAARRIVEGDHEMRAGKFQGWRPEYLLGHDLRDAKLGIIGWGRIGKAVAERAAAFGMQIVVAESSGTGPGSVVATHPLEQRVSLAELLETSDFISLHCPLTPETRHIIDEAALRKMKPTAILINTARGPVVDEGALVRALQERWIAGAALDVYENEPLMAPGLAECSNVVLAPHLGSATVRTRSEMARLVAENAIAILDGQAPPTCLNPEVLHISR